ncbi:MAG TPA: response regulator transcription factor [Acidimicrobiales bacterium]|nr:response regulator transcription factor [Acidimicrobiales bacterium]
MAGPRARADDPVLVVEDDDKFAQLLERAFGRAGMATVHARTGDDALRCVLRGTSIRAAVLDVMIPHPDGIEVCRHLRRLDPTLPVVAISARSGSEHRSRARAAGADAFLGKPFPLRELVELIEALISQTTHEPPEDP